MYTQSLNVNRISFHLPERAITNDEVAREHPSWNIEKAYRNTGVRRRFVSASDETALDLGLAACRKLLQDPAQLSSIDALIFCTQSPDYIMPSNAFVLHNALGLQESCLAFDYNLACTGFVYGLAMGQGFLSSGLAKNILLVTSDTYTKLIHPQDRSAGLLFSDGAAATLFSNEAGALRLLDLTFGTSGVDYDSFIIRAGGMRTPRTSETEQPIVDPSGNVRSLCHVYMDGVGILSFVNSKIPGHVRQILARNSLKDTDIALFVFHQASRTALDSLTRLLGLPKEKVFTNIEMTGNTVASSIPIALKEILDSQILKKGDKIVLCGFGVGLSWGAALMEAA
jgi:3-oxoacyl-[acyl-carrier-protein] synthase-3